MFDLRTIDPDGIRVIDSDSEGLTCRSGPGVNEAGIETPGCGTGAVEVTLDDVVVAGVEVEDYGVAFGGCGAVG